MKPTVATECSSVKQANDQHPLHTSSQLAVQQDGHPSRTKVTRGRDARLAYLERRNNSKRHREFPGALFLAPDVERAPERASLVYERTRSESKGRNDAESCDSDGAGRWPSITVLNYFFTGAFPSKPNRWDCDSEVIDEMTSGIRIRAGASIAPLRIGPSVIAHRAHGHLIRGTIRCGGCAEGGWTTDGQ
ncbi:hypothetical protein ACJRO7_036045 [Eucalyptus globulus]|uniref:Uncharacterized protein n=1 Tax=Eucalyptus globulus TaxID=34317 RepID=A0ABD3JET2_EUCGL